MYSVGILSGQGKWSHVLGEMLHSSGTRITGWINPDESSRLATRELIDFSDLVWIPEKMTSGMDAAVEVIRRSRHLSLGFPVVDFMDEASCLVKLAHEARVQVQVGQNDWHHPAVRSALVHIVQPQNITITHDLPGVPEAESHSLVFRSILANLDLALGFSGSTVKKIRPHASRLSGGATIQTDIRIEMHNGSVLNVVISKFTKDPRRQIRIIQADGLITIDLLKGTSELMLFPADGSVSPMAGKKLWPLPGHDPEIPAPAASDETAVARQCLTFIHALEKGRHSLSNLESGFRALEIARQIETHLVTL